MDAIGHGKVTHSGERKPQKQFKRRTVAFFHRDIVHGSQTNRTDQNRRAYLLAYQPAGLKQWRNGERRDIASPSE